MSGALFVDGLHRRRAVFAFGHHPQLGPGGGEHAAQFGAGQVFVVGDQGGGHAALTPCGRVRVAATPPSGRAFSVERGAVAMHLLQPFADVGQPQAAAAAGGAEAGAVVGHRDLQPAVGRAPRRCTSMCTGPIFGSTPCLTAFSASEISISGGQGAASSSGAHVDASTTAAACAPPSAPGRRARCPAGRPAWRRCRRRCAGAGWRRAGSPPGGRSSRWRARGSVAMALRTPARVLNRKCGSTCAASTDSRSSASRRRACASASARSRASACRPRCSRRQPNSASPPASQKPTAARAGDVDGASRPGCRCVQPAASARACWPAALSGVATVTPSVIATRRRLPCSSTSPVQLGDHLLHGFGQQPVRRRTEASTASGHRRQQRPALAARRPAPAPHLPAQPGAEQQRHQRSRSSAASRPPRAGPSAPR